MNEARKGQGGKPRRKARRPGLEVIAEARAVEPPREAGRASEAARESVNSRGDADGGPDGNPEAAGTEGTEEERARPERDPSADAMDGLEDARATAAHYPLTLEALLGDAPAWSSEGVPGLDCRITLRRVRGGVALEVDREGAEPGPEWVCPPDHPVGDALLGVDAEDWDEHDTGAEVLENVRAIWDSYVGRPVSALLDVGSSAFPEVPLAVRVFEPTPLPDRVSLLLLKVEGYLDAEGFESCLDKLPELPADVSLRGLVTAALRTNADELLEYLGACIERALVRAGTQGIRRNRSPSAPGAV